MQGPCEPVSLQDAAWCCLTPHLLPASPMLLWPPALPPPPHPQPRSPSSLSSHTPSSFLWQVLYTHCWEFCTSIHLAPSHQSRVSSNIPCSPVSSRTPFNKREWKFSLPTRFYSCPQLSFLVLFWSWPEVVLFIELYCVPHKTLCSRWWDFVLFTTVPHYLVQCRIVADTNAGWSVHGVKPPVLSLSSWVILGRVKSASVPAESLSRRASIVNF